MRFVIGYGLLGDIERDSRINQDHMHCCPQFFLTSKFANKFEILQRPPKYPASRTDDLQIFNDSSTCASEIPIRQCQLG